MRKEKDTLVPEAIYRGSEERSESPLVELKKRKSGRGLKQTALL